MPTEAEAVQRLFASLSPAEAKAVATERNSNGSLPLHCVARFAQGPSTMIEVFQALFRNGEDFRRMAAASYRRAFHHGRH
jgi:hypothetical protein